MPARVRPSSVRRARRAAAYGPFVAALLALPVARADGGDPVVVRAGTTAATLSDVDRALDRLSAFQIEALGGPSRQAVRKYVNDTLAPELQLASEADHRELGKTPAIAQRVDDAKSRALVDSIRRDVVAKGIPDADLRAYYDAHLAEYQKPERIAIWRILVNDEAAARALLGQLRGVDGPERWPALARDQSVDAATKMRGGVLGFVRPDGHTDVPQLDVDPALYVAAAHVRDGDLVTEPVKEGARFAVVWRRGTLPKVDRSFEQERASITLSLVEARVDDAVTGLLSDLRKRYVTLENDKPLESLRPDEPSAARESSSPSSVVPADPVPKPTDRGLR